jgi:hypothetical protein
MCGIHSCTVVVLSRTETQAEIHLGGQESVVSAGMDRLCVWGGGGWSVGEMDVDEYVLDGGGDKGG